MQKQGDKSSRVFVEESERAGVRGQKRIVLQMEQDDTDEPLFYD